ncbi:hypothetical protein JB92DRAFT_2707271 [Gautieria morchelliformis]|nr:hypothetical protein JB92DRAFT_2707271 [Gautieria morchelliformis]
MPWPEVVMDSFYKVPMDTTLEYEWYGPYNMLLNLLFPQHLRFEIAPQCAVPTNTRTAVHFTVFYLVKRGGTPIFFLEVKPLTSLEGAPDRNSADGQMRDRFAGLRHRLTIPKLYGISAMGTRLSVYEFNTRDKSLIPEKGEQYDMDSIPDFAPRENWKYDVLEEDGAVKLRAVVKDIKQMCGVE